MYYLPVENIQPAKGSYIDPTIDPVFLRRLLIPNFSHLLAIYILYT